MSFSRPRPTLEAIIAAALGYRDHAGVGQAIRRVEQGPDQLHDQLYRAVRRLESKLLTT